MKEFISDEEMAELESKNTSDFISDEEMDELVRKGSAQDVIPQGEDSYLKKAGNFLLEDVIAPVGTFIDQYGGGAASRSAIGEFMTPGKGVMDAAGAFADQYGEDPTKAPTGKQLAQRMGASERSLSDVVPGMYSETGEGLAFEKGGFFDPTASGAQGLGIELVADPLNLIPGVGIAKGAKAGIKTGAQAGKIVAKEASEAALKGVGKAAGSVAKGFKQAAIGTANKISDAADMASGVAKGESNVAKSINALIESQKGKMSKLADRNMDIAARLGIDPMDLPASTVFDGAIPRFERAIAYGPTGQEFLEKIEKFYDVLDNKTFQKVESIAGIPKEALSSERIGDFLVESVENATGNLFKNNEIRYSTIINNPSKPINLSTAASNRMLNSLDSIKTKATKMMKIQDPTLQAQAARLLQNINGVQDYANMGKGSADLDFFVENMKAVRELAYPPKSAQSVIQVTPDMQKAYQELYKTLNKSVLDSVFSYDSKMGKELLKSNEAITRFSRDVEPINKLIGGGRVSGSALFNSIKADAKKLESLKNVMAPEEFNLLKGALVKDVLNINAENQLMYAPSKKAFDSKKPLLSKFLNKKELADIEDTLSLGVQGEGRITSLPQTGAVLQFGDIRKQAVKDVTSRAMLESLKKSASKGNVRASKVYGHKEITLEAMENAKPTKSGLYSIEVPKATLDEFLKDFVSEKTSKSFMGVKALEQLRGKEEEQ